MSIKIGSTVPNFALDSTQGQINLDQFAARGWTLLISHPEDLLKFNVVRSGVLQRLVKRLQARNINILGLSELSYLRWASFLDDKKNGINFPVITDINQYKFPFYKDLKSIEFGNASRLFVLLDEARVIRYISAYPIHAERNFDLLASYTDHLQFSTDSPLSNTKTHHQAITPNAYQTTGYAA